MPQLFFRGSTTDPVFNPVTATNVLNLTRVRAQVIAAAAAAVAARSHDSRGGAAAEAFPSMDVAVHRIAEVAEGADSVAGIKAAMKRAGLGLGKKIPTESWCGFAAALSMDGKGYSTRYQKLLQMPVLVVKQDSPYQEWFSHLLYSKVGGSNL